MIALITDFGTGSYYAGLMRAAVKCLNPMADILDISHAVQPGSITNAQYILAASIDYLPLKTVLALVVDPGVGTDRRILIAELKDLTCILPDNGIISAIEEKTEKVLALDTSSLVRNASPSFHGRDIFAPVAAGIDRGNPIEKYGTGIRDWKRVAFYNAEIKDESILCRIVHIDRFGNCILNLPYDNTFFKTGTEGMIHSPGKKLAFRTVRTYSESACGKLCLIKGSSGFTELALNRGNASKFIGAEIDTPIEIRPCG